MGHEELLLWTSSPHPAFWHRISIFHCAASAECGWFLALVPGSSLTSRRRGAIASALDLCISMKCLSLLYFTAYQLMSYHLILFLLVKSVANASDLLAFYLWIFFVSSSILFSALTEVKWLSSLCILSPCLLPFQCSLLLGGSYRLFFLLMFLLYYCFNNVKSQVLAVIWHYCPFASLVTFFL